MQNHFTVSYLNEIRQMLHTARQKAYTAVNSAMVEAYWKIGQRIVVDLPILFAFPRLSQNCEQRSHNFFGSSKSDKADLENSVNMKGVDVHYLFQK